MFILGTSVEWLGERGGMDSHYPRQNCAESLIPANTFLSAILWFKINALQSKCNFASEKIAAYLGFDFFPSRSSYYRILHRRPSPLFFA
jgi:hypothetical protein